MDTLILKKLQAQQECVKVLTEIHQKIYMTIQRGENRIENILNNLSSMSDSVGLFFKPLKAILAIDKFTFIGPYVRKSGNKYKNYTLTW